MKISYNWLQQYFDKPLPKAHDLAELINSHVFEIESVIEMKSEWRKAQTDTVFDVKVLPDRAHYALCHKGVAREVRAITGMEMKNIANVKITVGEAIKPVEVKVTESKLCRRYIARRISGVNVTDSPAWLREKLEAIDARSINTIVDATNYIMFDIGQPLHAFDAAKVKGVITVRLAKKGEKIELLDARVLELNETDLVIADDEGPLAIAGVKGGRRAEISATTKDIILESANFNPVSVRRTSTRLNIRNDSSKRFENEIIPELAEEAMSRVTALIIKLSQEANIGTIKVSATTDIFSTPTKPWTVSVTSDFISEKLGANITNADFQDILKRYDCVVKGVSDITPPLDRLDLKIPEDFVDEVARVNGYEALEAILPAELPAKAASQIHDDVTFYWSEKVKNTLVGLGFSEALLYSLVQKGFYEITYPLASDKSSLRESIVPKMNDTLTTNALNADLLGLDIIKMFEIGKVFPKEGEKTVLCIGVKNVKKSKKKEPEILKEVLAELKKTLGVELTPEKITDNVTEIDLGSLFSKMKAGLIDDLHFQALPRDQKYHPFSPYPFITRDIAVFVPENVLGDGVWNSVKQGIQEAGAEGLLVRGALFDVFKKEGKVSYAYRLVFQSYEKTLTDTEVNTIMEKVYQEIREKDWEVR
ncbi:MAG: phenylalanine--tRNA ligase subunit beta [Candidatus Taylorbacteria bacterium]